MRALHLGIDTHKQFLETLGSYMNNIDQYDKRYINCKYACHNQLYLFVNLFNLYMHAIIKVFIREHYIVAFLLAHNEMHVGDDHEDRYVKLESLVVMPS